MTARRSISQSVSQSVSKACSCLHFLSSNYIGVVRPFGLHHAFFAFKGNLTKSRAAFNNNVIVMTDKLCRSFD